MNIENTLNYVPLFRDIVEIVFYIVIGIITVLTYRGVKDTLLQPIKTEIFKEQIKEFSQILKLFMGKGEIGLRQQFGFDKLFRANVFLLLDNYADTFFDVKVDPKTRPYNTTDCPSSLVTQEMMEKHFEVCDEYLAKENNPGPVVRDARARAAIWSKYKFGLISIPKEYSGMDDTLRVIMESPLLPKESVRLLANYREIANKNLMLLAELLSECAQELPEKYPNTELLNKASTDWMHHKYMERFVSLKEGADKIINFQRSYFNADKLIE